MSIYAELLFYPVNPDSVFSTTVGGSANSSRRSAPDGNATIFDAEAGTGGQNLEDAHSGGKIATAHVYTPGGSSDGATVDAETLWTLCDTVMGNSFQVAQFNVEVASPQSNETLREIPLLSGRCDGTGRTFAFGVLGMRGNRHA